MSNYIKYDNLTEPDEDLTVLMSYQSYPTKKISYFNFCTSLSLFNTSIENEFSDNVRKKYTTSGIRVFNRRSYPGTDLKSQIR